MWKLQEEVKARSSALPPVYPESRSQSLVYTGSIGGLHRALKGVDRPDRVPWWPNSHDPKNGGWTSRRMSITRSPTPTREVIIERVDDILLFSSFEN